MPSLRWALAGARGVGRAEISPRLKAVWQPSLRWGLFAFLAKGTVKWTLLFTSKSPVL